MLEQLADVHTDVHTREYWDFVAKRELRFQQCSGCSAFRFPPLTGCRECGATEVEWVAVAGRGRVFSYTIVHHGATPDVHDDIPYPVVVVEFDDAPGVRLISNVLDIDIDEIEVEMELDLVWDEPSPGVVLPRFKKA